MKKLNKFCAILFAMLGVSTLSAQTDVTSTYLTNAGFDDESGWITGNIGQATVNATTGWTASSSGDTWYYGGAVNYGSSFTVNSVTPPATNPDGVAEGGVLGLSAGWGCTVTYSQEVTLPAGIYTLSYKAYNANTAATQATNLIGFVSASTTAYGTITNFTADKWTEEAVAFTLVNETTGNISVGMGAISGGSGANAKLFIDGITLTYKSFSDVTESNPVDLTSMAGNSWSGQTGSVSAGSDAIPYVSERFLWAAAIPVGTAMSNTITSLPNGKYAVELYGASSSTSGRDNTNYVVTDGDTQYVTLKVNDSESQIPTYNRTSISDNMPYYTFSNVKVTDGTLNMSVNVNVLSPNWLLAKVKSITYLGPDLSIYQEAFTANYSTLSSLSTDGVPAAFATKINQLISAYATEPSTLSEYETANSEMQAVINAYPDVVDAYSFIVTCESILNNSDELEEGAKDAFATVVNTVKANVESATTAEPIYAEHSTLEAARQTYIQKAEPTNGTFFDYTFKITNPGFDNGTNGWACESGAQNKGIATNKTNGIITGAFFENWNGSAFTGSISQSVAGLPGGKYTFKAAAFGAGAYVFANDEQTAVTTADGEWYEVEVALSDGNLTFGLKNENAINWMGIDNASLYFYGFDVATAQAGVTSLKSQAEALVGQKMATGVATALSEAIAGADETKTTRDELETMTTALNTAIANANASIADYEEILAYITKAEGIDASIAADYRTQYNAGTIEDDAVTVFQNLEVATYNYVTENFEYPVALSDTWNSTGTNTSAADFTGEHWSNDNARKYKNQYDGWGDPKQGYPANSWSIDFDQEVTLPAGKYVFKVAGRKSVDTALELVVTQGETTLGTVNDFPSGNTGLGINKAGATSFDANDATGFAKDGAGYGWQWRYVMFELDEEAAVKVAVHAETSKIYNWVSFGDYTLQMTEETYLEANKGGVEAAETAAQALVNTKPMGDAENAALQAALDMTYTTGAEMLAKVTALETAVANANTWRSTYNTEKGKLVAALERFEADYNDAENGALDHMAKSRWETVIAKAQAAAVAKDDLTSHEGLTTATTELVAALDAATVSVNEYAALDKAIKAATALAAVELNWGDQPFQRPESAKAGLDTVDEQAVYDAAEADGEGVTALTEALNAAMDITLNVPSGDFYLTVATEGHKYLNKPVFASLGTTGDNNPTGYVFNTTGATADTHKFTFEQVEGNNMYRISVEVGGETVYLTTGSLNGSAAGWAKQQIQGTTDVEKAATFKIETSPAVEGAFRIYNTVHNAYVDCQDGGNIYTDTDIQREDFAIVEDYIVSTTIDIAAENMWSTCVLMFGVTELPEGLRAFKSSELAEGSQSLVLEEVKALEAYTPYILYAQEGYQGTLTGAVDFTNYVAVADDKIALKGAVEQQTITEGYILQNQGYGMKFYKILDSTEFTIPVGKCWLEVGSFDTGTQAVTLKFKEGTTGIEGVALDVEVLNAADGIYTIDGKRVSDMQKGQIYVVGGKKTINR